MLEQQVKEHFRKQVGDYVGLMSRLVPDYEMGQNLLCELIPFSKEQHIKVLDLGSGPGVLSELVLKMYPSSQVHAFDLTEEMLELCQERLGRLATPLFWPVLMC
ncbi:MAG: class I SAM-dependent methyltransferase [Planctomycetes bacterium]|nr:class I SAM-dependent methyltransferase [Planctomycetota bacterium]